MKAKKKTKQSKHNNKHFVKTINIFINKLTEVSISTKVLSNRKTKKKRDKMTELEL